MSTNVNLNINVDVAELVKTAINITPKTQSYNSRMIDNNNGRFVSMQTNGLVISACYHKTKNHSATAQSMGTAKSTAAPGTWAVAYINSSPLAVDKTFYDFW